MLHNDPTWQEVNGIIIGYLMPEMDSPKWDFRQCHGEILVVRDDSGHIWLRAIINDVFLAESDDFRPEDDPELNFRVGQRVWFMTNNDEQMSYSYVE